MSINKLLLRLKGLESEIKEAISEVESLKKAIVGEDDFLKGTEWEGHSILFTGGSATRQTNDDISTFLSNSPSKKGNVGLEITDPNNGNKYDIETDTWKAGEEFASQSDSATIGEIDAITLQTRINEREREQSSDLDQKIYFICAQPNTIYYAWQLEVMLRNFNEMGILDNPKYEVHIVTNIPYGLVESEFYKLSKVEHSHTNLQFYYYADKRATKHYPSSIRPNLLKQHFAKHPEIKTFFYHDCDMIFTNKDLDFTPFLQDDICYGSDVRFYIGHDYIASKEHNVLEYMCNIAQIPLRVVRDNEHNCIGAQYLIKNVSADFWEEVEKISEELFQKITIRNNYIKANYPKSYASGENDKGMWDVYNAKDKIWEYDFTREVAENRAKQLSNYHELQIFAADMWAVLWCLWKLGKKTVPHKFFDFAWATDTIERYNECNIYHNAGVTESGHGLFFKGEFQDKVPDKNLRINPHSACSPYYELVKQIMIVK